MKRLSEERAMGFEPTTNGLEGRHSTTELRPQCALEGVLYCLVDLGRVGFEPTKAEPSDLQSDPFDRSGIDPCCLVCCSVVASGGIRTRNRPLTRRMLYQLSYASGISQLARATVVKLDR